MSELLSPDAPRRLLSELCRLAAERAAAEQSLRGGFDARNEAAEKEFQDAERSLTEHYTARKAAVETEYAGKHNATAAKLQAEHDALQKEYESVKAKAIARFTADQEAAQQALQDAHWEATEAADAARGGLNLPLKELLAALDSRWQQLETIHRDAVELMQRRGHWSDLPELPPVGVILEKQPGRRFCHALEQSQAQFRVLSKQLLPRFFQGLRPLGLFILLWLVAACPLLALFKVFEWWNWWHWAAATSGVAVIVGLVAGVWTYRVAKRKSVAAYLALRRTMLEAGLGYPNVLETTKAECQRLDATIIARHKAQSQKADETFAAATARIERRRQKEMKEADNLYPCRLADLAERRDRMLKEIEDKGPPLLRRIEEQYAAESQRIRQRHQQALEESRRQFDHQWTEMANRWWSGIERFRLWATEADQACREAFPHWNTDDWDRWSPPSAIPPAVLLGHSEVKLAEIPGGLSEDERLRPEQAEYALPVVLPFPRRSLLLLKADGPGRARAVDLLQGAMLRLLTALPPGKVRFTIIDPVGLGDNFSAFMHLADFDEQLVASRIWTDTIHIEQRLADLTKHMENVIQVYLRQEFRSIEEYNAFAGEMAEPYRVLVVANFPANFSEAALQRIKSIAASGARCGVFVMLSVDPSRPCRAVSSCPISNPRAWCSTGRTGVSPGTTPISGRSPLISTCPRRPNASRRSSAGSAARPANRAASKCPSRSIIPAPKTSGGPTDSRAGIDVPLGRAGAMKLQHLDLGHGTSQHVLISGKTGSGKSTLLHVLITNMALRYSPDEVELYLVDFKKGVEFKAYARATLPHARVVAIESEREFGLSVLQRLDAELRTRGDMFRRRGVQDLKGYRTAEPEVRLPRIMLIIDEFQELFVEDDRIAQEAALLLDRLVRQGRAFGIHVLLGSQTLGGAYTLARSTIGQMAVRIALQCSEADAHLILSEDNTAARLLTRPGEAIYNDANGLYEGNHPFQIVWLPDGERDDYLQRIDQLARQRHCTPPPPIVFEGNVLADLIDNPLLKELIEAPQWPAPRRRPRRGSAPRWPSRIPPRPSFCVRTAATC